MPGPCCHKMGMGCTLVRHSCRCKVEQVRINACNHSLVHEHTRSCVRSCAHTHEGTRAHACTRPCTYFPHMRRSSVKPPRGRRRPRSAGPSRRAASTTPRRWAWLLCTTLLGHERPGLPIHVLAGASPPHDVLSLTRWHPIHICWLGRRLLTNA